MPDRYLRGGIITSDAVNSLSFGGEVFYRRLMSVVDDYGRFDGRPAVLLAALFPLKLDEVAVSQIEAWLEECDDTGLVQRYSVEGKQYIQIYRFNQRIRSASKWPDPPSIDCQHSAGTCQHSAGTCQHSAGTCQQSAADCGSRARAIRASHSSTAYRPSEESNYGLEDRGSGGKEPASRDQVNSWFANQGRPELADEFWGKMVISDWHTLGGRPILLKTPEAVFEYTKSFVSAQNRFMAQNGSRGSPKTSNAQFLDELERKGVRRD